MPERDPRDCSVNVLSLQGPISVAVCYACQWISPMGFPQQCHERAKDHVASRAAVIAAHGGEDPHER